MKSIRWSTIGIVLVAAVVGVLLTETIYTLAKM